MKITFYNPSKIIGGAELLFYRLLLTLLEKNIECSVIDYKDGAFSKLGLHAKHITQIDSVLSNVKIECDVLIMPPNYCYEAISHLHTNDETKVLFWSIHPLNCIPLIPFKFYKQLNSESIIKRALDFLLLSKQQSFARTLFAKAAKLNALVFMDGENYRSARSFIQENLPENFLPIPVPRPAEKALEARKSRLQKDLISLFWIGRLVDFKIGALNRLISDLDSLSKLHNQNISLFIIGEGNDERSLIQSKDLNIIKLGHLTNEAMHERISKEADAVFGMGTSVLESAILGIPSFLMRPSYETVVDKNAYTPLPQTKNFDLGSFSELSRSLEFDQLHLLERISDADFGKKCKQYVESHHLLDNIVDKLLIKISESRLSIRDIKPMAANFRSRELFCILTGR